MGQGVERTLELFQGVSRFFETLVNDQQKNESPAEESPSDRNEIPLSAWLAGTTRQESTNVSSIETSSPESKVCGFELFKLSLNPHRPNL
jgi:hypothetical protein